MNGCLDTAATSETILICGYNFSGCDKAEQYIHKLICQSNRHVPPSSNPRPAPLVTCLTGQMPNTNSCVSDPGAKFVYVVRNPKDAAVARYQYTGMDTLQPFSMFLEKFIASPELPLGGGWYLHTRAWTQFLSHLPREHFHVIYFHSLIQNPEEELSRLCHFLPSLNLSPDTLTSLCSQLISETDLPSRKRQRTQHTHTDQIHQVGIWKEYFTVTQQEQFDAVLTQLLSNVPFLDTQTLLS